MSSSTATIAGPSTIATVKQLMAQIERQSPHRVAVEGSGVHVTLGELRRISNRLANVLIGMGLEPGSRVAFVGENHPDYLILEFALLKAGLVKVPLNHRLTPGELARCMELADVRVAFVDATTAGALEEVWSSPLEGPTRVLYGTSDPGSLWQLIDAASDVAPRVETTEDDLYHIRFSSGSTGTPKGIAISHRAARAAILGNTWVMSSNAPVPVPRTLQVAPLVYAGGWSVLPTLLCGGTNVVMPRFDADLTLETIAAERITWMFAVPTMLRRLSASSRLDLLRESQLGCLMLAGEPAAMPALEIMSEHTDAMVQCWGQTEAPASTTVLSRTEMRDPGLWSSIGRPVPGVEFSLLVDGEVLDIVEPGAEGELVIRTPSKTSGLLGAEAEFAARSLADGWWRTSDLGRFDDEGRVYIIGRASETIITGGTNIQPVEIERALEEHGSVREAVVVGVPDERWGETPAALIYAPQASAQVEEELLAFTRKRLAGFKRPGHMFITRQPIPRLSGDSKVARGEMKRVLASWVSAAESIPEHVTKAVEKRG